MVTKSEEQLYRLAEAMLEGTDQGRVPWAPLGDDSYIFSGTRSSVIIRSGDGDGQWPFTFELLTEDNNVADSITTGFYTADTLGNQEAQEWNDAVSGLYYAARSKALRIDELTAAILEDIQAGRASDRPLPSATPKSPRHAPVADDLDDLPF